MDCKYSESSICENCILARKAMQNKQPDINDEQKLELDNMLMDFISRYTGKISEFKSAK